MNRFGNTGLVCCLGADRSLGYIGAGERGSAAAGVFRCVMLGGLFLLASCAMPPRSSQAELQRFRGAANADLIVRYYSDQVSHLLKPLTMEGPFYVACERPEVLKLAAQQPKHEMAVVVLIHYCSSPAENRVKLAWAEDLKRLGYHDIVFLLAGRGREIEGLPILPGPEYQPTVAKQ